MLVWLVSIACGPYESMPTPPPVTVPSNWTVAASDVGDIRVALPPWLVAFDTRTGVLANEVPRAPGAGFLELLAEGPRSVEPQPASVEQIDDWLAARLNLDAAKVSGVAYDSLPAGEAVWYAGVDGAGTPAASRYLAYAIITDAGVAFLLIDGPAGLWATHLDDIGLIPYLVEVGFAT